MQTILSRFWTLPLFFFPLTITVTLRVPSYILQCDLNCLFLYDLVDFYSTKCALVGKVANFFLSRTYGKVVFNALVPMRSLLTSEEPGQYKDAYPIRNSRYCKRYFLNLSTLRRILSKNFRWRLFWTWSLKPW